MDATETDTLFRSPDLDVRRAAGFDTGVCVVTFTPFTDRCTLDRPGYAERFFARRRIDAVHVVARGNDWYQYAELPDAMAAVHAATRPYGRVVTYGSSMGAYAAIRFAGLAGATGALALSPQYSVIPATVPFERRWPETAPHIRPLWEGTLPFPTLQDAYVVYDPRDPDAKHAALLRREFRFNPVKLRDAGHPVTATLHELGLLERLVLGVVRGGLDVPAFTAEAWARRHQSARFLTLRANRAWRLPRKIALLRQAVQASPNSADARAQLGTQLAHAGQSGEPAGMSDSALALEPEQPNILLHYSKALERTGDLPGALALTERALAASGNTTLYGERLDRLRAGLHR